MNRNKHTGRELYLYAFQIVSLLPLIYMILFTDMFSIITAKNVFGFLFDLGLVCLPKIELWILSFIYHRTLNEVYPYFIMPFIALFLGLKIRRRFSEKDGNKVNLILVILISADLVLRLLPMAVNSAFPVYMQIIGFVFRLTLLILILKDQIRSGKVTFR